MFEDTKIITAPPDRPLRLWIERWADEREVPAGSVVNLQAHSPQEAHPGRRGGRHDSGGSGDQQTNKRSTAMSIWGHLFLTGEFRAREDLLSGLTLEQVTLRPTGASHSIYEELWHAATIQGCVVAQDKELEAMLRGGKRYPSAVPDQEQQWHDLVQQFLEGARAVVALAQEPRRLALEVEPGLTMGEELNCLAVHNAYHLGKIVALRQRIGAWPPNAATKQS